MSSQFYKVYLLSAAWLVAIACDGAGAIPIGDTKVPADALLEVLPDGAGDDAVPLDGVGPADLDLLPDTEDVCAVKPPLEPFQVSVELPGGEPGVSALASGEAVVSQMGPYCCDANWEFEIHFTVADGTEVTLLLALPDGQSPPVAQGQTVYLHAQVEQPWWTNQYLAVWDDAGTLRFFLYDGSSGYQPVDTCGDSPCPRVRMVPVDCPPEDAECGTQVHPPLEFRGAWPDGAVVVPQGESLTMDGAGPAGTFYSVRSRLTVEMQCVDYPGDWMSAFFVGPPEP